MGLRLASDQVGLNNPSKRCSCCVEDSDVTILVKYEEVAVGRVHAVELRVGYVGLEQRLFVVVLGRATWLVVPLHLPGPVGVCVGVARENRLALPSGPTTWGLDAPLPGPRI